MSPDPAPTLGAPALVAPPSRRGIGLTLLRLGRGAFVTLPLWLLRAAFWPRRPGIADLSDHALADIGLTRSDVADYGRRGAADAELATRLGRPGDWSR